VIMDCERALRWLAIRLEGELVECEQSALASVQEDYWRGRIASTKEALKLVRGTYRRVSMGEQDV
jgi:hypothetical protein